MKDWKGGSSSVWKTIGASNYSNSEREADEYYATDPMAIDKLLEAIYPNYPNHRIWECACGEGHLAERLVNYGFCVHSTDKVDRGYKRHAKTFGEIVTKKESPICSKQRWIKFLQAVSEQKNL